MTWLNTFSEIIFHCFKLKIFQNSGFRWIIYPLNLKIHWAIRSRNIYIPFSLAQTYNHTSPETDKKGHQLQRVLFFPLYLAVSIIWLSWRLPYYSRMLVIHSVDQTLYIFIFIILGVSNINPFQASRYHSRFTKSSKVSTSWKMWSVSKTPCEKKNV